MLSLNFEICQSNNCQNLTFTETTGAYNATYNLGGYGSPNIETSDVLTAVLIITSPSGIEYPQIDLYSTGDFPTDSLTDEGYVITLIPDTSLEDGEWTFTYAISTFDEEYTKTITKLLFCNANCCVSTMLSNLQLNDTCDSCKPTEQSMDYLKIWTFLQSLKKAAYCGDVDNFTNLLKIINKLCKNKGCKTCN